MKTAAALWSDADTERLFANLGRYVVIFQAIEGFLDQILLLVWGHENWSKSQARIAEMKNAEKIRLVRESIATSERLMRCHTRPSWCAGFVNTIERLNKERKRRNEIIHSQILMDHVEAGIPALMSNRRKIGSEIDFKRQVLSTSFWEALFGEISELAFSTGQIQIQIAHDADAPLDTFTWWQGSTSNGLPYNEIIARARSGKSGQLRMQFIGESAGDRAKEVESALRYFPLHGLGVRILVGAEEPIRLPQSFVQVVKADGVPSAEFRLELMPS